MCHPITKPYKRTKMAIVKDNVLTKGFSGTIGRMFTFRQIGGKTFVSKFQRPPNVVVTDKMVAARTKFSIATAYAKNAVKDPEIKALYQAAAKGGQRAFNVAIVDALNAPTVESIEAQRYHGGIGDRIIIKATDDFKVASVRVTVRNANGGLVEQGDAVPKKTHRILRTGPIGYIERLS